MKIEFVKDSDLLWCAISTDEVYKGKVCSELFWAEIEVYSDHFIVVYEDSYREKHKFNTMEDAQQSILLEYRKHTPHINGATYETE
jgi:hypothetical protein